LPLNRPFHRAPLLPLLVLGFALNPADSAFAFAAPIKVDTGQIGTAKFAIANPPGAWNHDLLLLAHGYRPDSAPLVADLHPERPSNKALLDEGWMVATTSYRRNGLIVGDAIADLDALRAYIANAYGDPDRVILEGESIGGLVVTIMAERDPGPYQGAVVFDATLYAKEPDMRVGLSLLPRIPLLFVATLRESREAKAYLTALVARPEPVVQPALFLISREGHTNINQAERLGAFRALGDWIDRGREALPRPRENTPYYDATVPPDPGPSTAVPHPDSAGIAPMTFFQLEAGGHAYRALYGRTYSDVKNDAWIAFPDAEGRTVLSRNFANAAGSARLKVGDAVSLAAYDPRAPQSP